MKMFMLFIALAAGMSSVAQAGLSGECTLVAFDAKLLGDITPIITEVIQVQNVDNNEWVYPIPHSSKEIRFAIRKTNMINGFRNLNLTVLDQGPETVMIRKNAQAATSVNDLAGFTLAVASNEYGAYLRCE
jgi:hypothetical protein